MTKRMSERKAVIDAVGQAPDGSGVLRRMRLSDVFSGSDEDRTAFEEFLKPDTDRRS